MIIEEDTASVYDNDSASSDVDVAEESNERTPLVVKPESITSSRRRFSPFQKVSAFRSVSPLALAALGGLLVGLVPGIKHRVAEDSSSVWQTAGMAVVALGMVFPVVEMVGMGAGLRAGGKRS